MDIRNQTFNVVTPNIWFIHIKFSWKVMTLILIPVLPSRFNALPPFPDRLSPSFSLYFICHSSSVLPLCFHLMLVHLCHMGTMVDSSILTCKYHNLTGGFLVCDWLYNVCFIIKRILKCSTLCESEKTDENQSTVYCDMTDVYRRLQSCHPDGFKRTHESFQVVSFSSQTVLTVFPIGHKCSMHLCFWSTHRLHMMSHDS